ncbi:hypothetical protein BD310DRAFT_922946 [Dichomitus squalens]|uniref:Uncharacterized protein n=1 Tax=Dichomitus squalens TaxID=114155 RepID=A0A4Q9Q0A7_9APHY|nr:hypothetical protein BD310DRAFT_922946 [Dichomitus squalens]
MLSSTNAFRSVPHKVSSNSQICRSMVSCPRLVYFRCLVDIRSRSRLLIGRPHISRDVLVLCFIL